MPTYQYACTNTDGRHEFEVVQSFTDAPVAECPTCGSTVRKVYGSVGVVFKGSGFYRTDSRKSGSGESSTSSSGGESGGSTSSSSTSSGSSSNASSSNASSPGSKASASSSSSSSSSKAASA